MAYLCLGCSASTALESAKSVSASSNPAWRRADGHRHLRRYLQTTHWPKHKGECHETQVNEGKLQQLALVNPVSGALNQDLRDWINDVASDCIVSLRSALALNEPTTLVDTHILFISLKYDERPKKLRERFLPLLAETLPIDEARATLKERLRIQGAPELAIDDPKSTEIDFHTSIIVCATREGSRAKGALYFTAEMPVWTTYGTFSWFIPIKEWAANPDWAAHLKMSLRRPRLSTAELVVEDLRGTESVETIHRWQMNWNARGLEGGGPL